MSRAVNISVKPLKRDTSEKLIRRFRRKVKKSGILDEVRKRQYYKKPSELRREKIIRRKRETAKLERKKK
jgi:small subunit ribosomal protein S21